MTETAKKEAGAPKAGAAKAKKKVKKSAKKMRAKQQTKIMENVMTEGTVQFDKLTRDAAKSSKEQTDALIKSGTLFMKGFENITKTYVSFVQDTTEKNSQALKSIMSCKTLNEFTETQNKWAQQSFDDFMSGVTKISELSVKVASEAFEPINDQLSKSVKKASESLAA